MVASNSSRTEQCLLVHVGPKQSHIAWLPSDWWVGLVPEESTVCRRFQSGEMDHFELWANIKFSQQWKWCRCFRQSMVNTQHSYLRMVMNYLKMTHTAYGLQYCWMRTMWGRCRRLCAQIIIMQQGQLQRMSEFYLVVAISSSLRIGRCITSADTGIWKQQPH